MKLILKYGSVLILCLFIFTLVGGIIAFAETPDDFKVDDTVTSITDQANSNQAAGEDSILTLGATLLYAIKVVGTTLGVILLIWFGLKWMTAAPAARAQLKDQAWNYVIGAVLLFGAGPIAQWIFNIVTKTAHT